MALLHALQAAQALRDEDDAAAPGAKRKQPDQGKLDEAVEREKAKQAKAKEDAKEKASSGVSVSLLRWDMRSGGEWHVQAAGSVTVWLSLTTRHDPPVGQVVPAAEEQQRVCVGAAGRRDGGGDGAGVHQVRRHQAGRRGQAPRKSVPVRWQAMTLLPLQQLTCLPTAGL